MAAHDGRARPTHPATAAFALQPLEPIRKSGGGWRYGHGHELQTWQTGLEVSQEADAHADLHEVSIPGLCSKEVLVALLSSGRLEIFDNPFMESTLMAAWNLFGEPWFWRTSLRHVIFVLLFVLWSVLLHSHLDERNVQLRSGTGDGADDIAERWQYSLHSRVVIAVDFLFIVFALFELAAPLHVLSSADTEIDSSNHEYNSREINLIAGSRNGTTKRRTQEPIGQGEHRM